MTEKPIKKTALFISPHLDDAVFSCGGTMAKMADEGWQTILCTVFTKSVFSPKDFALACQLDKNLASDVDYMKLRRAEDSCAARILNVSETLHLNFSEAPHRGYNSSPELFAGIKPGDRICRNIAEHLALLGEIYEPEIVFAPQGLGNHCDHLQVIEAVIEFYKEEKVYWYYDTPYAIRQPEAQKYPRLPLVLKQQSQNISAYLNAKIEACAAYKSQINFQFGSRVNLKKMLTNFHLQSKKDLRVGKFVEHFLVENIKSTRDFAP